MPVPVSDRVSVVNDQRALWVLIDGLPHVSILQSELVGWTAWWGQPVGMWSVEFVLRGGGAVLVEYDQRELWEAVLGKLRFALGDAVAADAAVVMQ